MKYNLDLSKISIDKYRDILKQQDVLPSRKILHHNLDENFDILYRCHVTNLFELKSVLSTANKLNLFHERSGLSKGYLTMLGREIRSIEPKTVFIKDFYQIDEKILKNLENEGLKTSKDYYEYFHSLKDQNEMTQKFQISLHTAQALSSLCDLVRINGVGGIAAKIFFEAGYKSVYAVSTAEAKDMLKNVLAVNAKKEYYKNRLSTKDMQFCIGYANIIKTFEEVMV